MYEMIGKLSNETLSNAIACLLVIWQLGRCCY